MEQETPGICLVVGAGISFPAPSSLPLFANILRVLLCGLGIDPEDPKIKPLIKQLAPETLLSYLASAGIDIYSILADLLSGHEPNALHYAIAQAINEGVTVWTPNVDELIEAASKETISTFIGKDGNNIPDGPALFKLHGTIEKPETMVFEVDHVAKPLASSLQNHLESTFANKVVLVAGFAGVDLDLKPAFLKAFEKATKVIWFELESRHDGIKYNYESLTNLVLNAYHNPSVALFEEIVRRFPGIIPTRLIIDLW